MGKTAKLLIISAILSTTVMGALKTGADYEKNPISAGNMPVFYEQIKDKMTFPMGWEKNTKSPKEWRATGLAKAKELMIPDLSKFDFNPVVIDEIDRGTYTAQKVVFNISPESRVLGILLTPKGKGPFPGAVMLHDHGAKFDIGKEKMIETWGDDEKLESSKAWGKRFFTEKFPGDELAKRGYVVLATDALGWGERAGNGFEAQQALASNLMNIGTSYASIMAQEDVKTAEFLSTLPSVDKKKIAAVGFSMGSFRAWQLAALSDNISAAIADCWIGTMKGLMVEGNNQLKGQSAFTMLHPNLGRYMDYPDVAGLAAPKAMLFYAGEQDRLFPKESVEEAFSTLKKVWKANGAEDKLETKMWPLGHVFVEEMQKESYDWLDKQFKIK